MEVVGLDIAVEFDAIAGHLNALHGRLVGVAAWLLDHPDEWQGDGVWTPETFLCWRTGVSRATAAKVVDIARRADEFPASVDRMNAGELSLDQLAPIARHAPAWADAQMSRLAPRLTASQVSKVARQYPWQPDAVVPDPNDSDRDEVDSGLGDVEPTSVGDGSREPDDEAWYAWDDAGRFRMHLDVSADTGSVIETALDECRDRLFHARTDDADVAVVDAVFEMASRSLSAIESPSRQARYRANVHVDAATGTISDRRGRTLRTGSGERILCDALAAVVHTDRGVPVSVGRSQYIVPDRTRRIVEHRDGGCRVPGCSSTGFVEVHHIEHWLRGGRTDTANLLSLCPKHHRLHHQGKLGIVGDADRPPGSPGSVEFSDRNGVPIRPSGASPVPPERPPPSIDGVYRHPLGERLDMEWLHFQPPDPS